MVDINKKVLELFVDSSNRPKKTPRHESAIQVLLERNFTSGQVKTALNNLEKAGVLSCIYHDVKDVGQSKFYFSTKLSGGILKEIPDKINRTSKWISKYSDNTISKMIGEHLHYLVKSELRVQGFKILGEKRVNSYGARRWNKTKHSLDIIAKHSTRDLVVGVEVKNMLPLTPKSEIDIKLQMCDYLGIVPIIACRWMEPYRDLISQKGFLWQFYDQLYPIGQESLVSEIRKRFLLPVRVSGELPLNSIVDFENWLRS